MKGLFIPEITAEMFRNGCLEQVEALMSEGEIYDIEYEPTAEPKWIPVSERLPEEDGMYLISHQNGKVFLDKWLGYDGWENFISVKAWMPLPEAYQPGVSE